ncbi:MAG: phosphoribosylformylglycinamidine cyclo-ligase [Acidobacteriota bacterium]
MKDEAKKGLTYRDAGVDIDAARRAKERIKQLARSTFTPAVLTEIGAFAGVFRPGWRDYEDPVLLASADGVGTKLKIAFLTGRHNTVGVDIVAHCTNDILVLGARPLFFLDYLATGKLEPGVVEQVVEGLAEGCRRCRCVLLGGETAEMPDFYAPGEYDLAGFIVGIAERGKLLTPDRVQEGDVLLGLPSSGLHTNGYSLVRKLCFEREGLRVDDYIPEFGRTLGEELLEPHRPYLDVLDPLLERESLHGLAHITGGGITENLDRVLPSHLDAVVRRGAWEVPPIFRFIQERGGVGEDEMFRTFNMGIGMILIVAGEAVAETAAVIRNRGLEPVELGTVEPGSGKVRYR